MRLPIRVEVRAAIFPYQSTNPETPGWVHWALDEKEGVLYCSQAAFARLRELPDAQKDELVFAMGGLK